MISIVRLKVARTKNKGEQVVAFTVKRLPESVVNAFAGAVCYQGKTIQDVMAEIMAEYAERVLGKVSKG